jgi:hypothetical protein
MIGLGLSSCQADWSRTVGYLHRQPNRLGTKMLGFTCAPELQACSNIICIQRLVVRFAARHPADFISGDHALGGIVTADFNGDGKPDLACLIVFGGGSFPTAGNLTVLLGNGDGTFQPAYSLALPASPEVLWAGDFNGDGKIDLGFWYAPNGSAASVSIFPGKGDGTLRSLGGGSSEVLEYIPARFKPSAPYHRS